MAGKLTAREANDFLATAFAGRADRGEIIEVDEGRAVARLHIDHTHLRPGGYVSGPTQMALADMVSYMAIMTRIGVSPMAVTSNLNIHFLRPCLGETVIADGRILKLGRTLAIVEVHVRAEHSADAASHATVTYALPNPRAQPTGDPKSDQPPETAPTMTKGSSPEETAAGNASSGD